MFNVDIYRVCLILLWLLLLLRETHNTLQLPVFFFFSFFSFFCQPYSEYRGIRSKKLFYRPLNSLYNSVICSYKKEISQVYSFSEQVTAKGNSPKDQTVSSGQKPAYTVKILISEIVPFAAAFYFGQVFVFCRFIKKYWNGFY